MVKLAGEYRFELRLRKLFERAGFVVIKCARSKPFDLIVMKGGKIVAIEVKSGRGRVTREQLEMQRRLASQAGVDYAILRQRKRGRIRVSSFRGLLSKEALIEIENALGRWLVK